MSDTVDTVRTQPVSNTKKCTRARFWLFTWNNFPVDWKTQLTQYFEGAEKYIMQPEKGQNGTPHIQGFVGFKNARDFNSLKKLNNEIHWEMSRSNAAEKYCMKEETRIGDTVCKGYKIAKPVLTELRPWQKNIIDIIGNEPDDRKIIWIYDKDGGQGKTKLCKHICSMFPKTSLYVSGKASDIKCAVAEFTQENELKVALFGFTRTIEDYVSYEAIEAIKDGIFFSGKYESRMCIYDSPHVICFANFEPCYENLSKDRWEVIKL